MVTLGASVSQDHKECRLVLVLELSLSHLSSPRTTAAVTSQQRASADTAGPSRPLQGPTRDIWYNI